MNSGIIVKQIEEMEQFGIRSVTVAAGVFDGVHRGHLQVLRAMLRISAQTDSVPCVLTFSPHPRSVLPGKTTPAMILPEEEKYRLLFAAGAKVIVVQEFTREFAALAPEDFLRKMLQSGNITMKGLTVGNSWRFGAGASGTCETIMKFAGKETLQFIPVPELMLEGRVVSSSGIRNAISSGAIDTARKMLGRRPALFGKVVHGLGLAGKVLGFPTANIQLANGIFPAYGVYTVYILVNGTVYPAVANAGVAPTVREEDDPKPKLEVHIPGFSGDLYDTEVKVELVRKIRPEQKFNGLDELKKQMAADLKLAMTFLI